MEIKSISEMPTCVDSIPVGSKGVHESTLRAYQILERTKDFLKRGVPQDIVLELIEEMESTGTRDYG